MSNESKETIDDIVKEIRGNAEDEGERRRGMRDEIQMLDTYFCGYDPEEALVMQCSTCRFFKKKHSHCTLKDSLTNARYKCNEWKFKTNKECADEYKAEINREFAELRAENARLRAAFAKIEAVVTLQHAKRNLGEQARRVVAEIMSACRFPDGALDEYERAFSENARLRAALKPVLDIVMDSETSSLSMEIAINEAKRIYNGGGEKQKEGAVQ